MKQQGQSDSIPRIIQWKLGEKYLPFHGNCNQGCWDTGLWCSSCWLCTGASCWRKWCQHTTGNRNERLGEKKKPQWHSLSPWIQFSLKWDPFLDSSIPWVNKFTIFLKQVQEKCIYAIWMGCGCLEKKEKNPKKTQSILHVYLTFFLRSFSFWADFVRFDFFFWLQIRGLIQK